jgi:hypothetical protein
MILKEIGKYNVSMKEDGSIVCTCPHGCLYPNAWQKGQNCCKHIREFVKELNNYEQK